MNMPLHGAAPAGAVVTPAAARASTWLISQMHRGQVRKASVIEPPTHIG